MGRTIESVQECNLIEEPEGEMIAHTDDSFCFTIKPYEIKSYRVVLK